MNTSKKYHDLHKTNKKHLNKYIINIKYIKSSTKPIKIAKNNLEKLQQNIDFKAKI